jgi:hypothetical protein
MNDQARERKLDRVEAARASQGGAARYERYQRDMRKGMPRGVDGPRPREFDTNGFPVAQRNASFVQRVARLLSPV